MITIELQLVDFAWQAAMQAAGGQPLIISLEAYFTIKFKYADFIIYERGQTFIKITDKQYAVLLLTT